MSSESLLLRIHVETLCWENIFKRASVLTNDLGRPSVSEHTVHHGLIKNPLPQTSLCLVINSSTLVKLWSCQTVHVIQPFIWPFPSHCAALPHYMLCSLHVYQVLNSLCIMCFDYCILTKYPTVFAHLKRSWETVLIIYLLQCISHKAGNNSNLSVILLCMVISHRSHKLLEKQPPRN